MMMRCFRIMLFACLILASPLAMAQQTLDLKPTAVDQAPVHSDILPQTPGGPEIDESDTRGLSNHFYNRCMDKPDPLLNSYDQEAYCTCLSAQIQSKDLNTAERVYIATGQGQKVDNDHIKKVIFAPCVSIPARAQVFKNCQTQENPFKYVRSYAALDLFCKCIVDDLDYYLEEVAPVFIKANRLRGAQTDDPVRTVTDSWDFKTEFAKSRSRCVKHYGRRD